MVEVFMRLTTFQKSDDANVGSVIRVFDDAVSLQDYGGIEGSAGNSHFYFLHWKFVMRQLSNWSIFALEDHARFPKVNGLVWDVYTGPDLRSWLDRENDLEMIKQSEAFLNKIMASSWRRRAHGWPGQSEMSWRDAKEL